MYPLFLSELCIVLNLVLVMNIVEILLQLNINNINIDINRESFSTIPNVLRPNASTNKWLKSFEQMRCLTQLRISCHQLKIETGRYQGTLLQDRKCERCSSGEVEDEYHFLFHCNKLENDRNLLLKEIAKSCPNFKRLNSKDKLVWLINTKEQSVFTTIATFIIKNMN